MSRQLARSPTRGILLLPALLIGSACVTPAAPRTGPHHHDGQLITAEQIEQSGGENVWQVLRRSGANLQFATNRNGHAVAATRRGQSGMPGAEGPLVVLDGVLTAGVDLLNLPATQIESIRVLSALQATRYFGMRGGAGAILIESRRGARR